MLRLDRLEIHGFKSFGDRTELRFRPGVTAVVGPNGCGKSNIGDAINWVLGEQSARMLRGQQMADVIFGGSEGRKPRGLAEVSLSFCGADGLPQAEQGAITITRRLYRSGESEYRLNGVQARLKDIQELLRQARVGARTYATIEQGKIDQVLNAKPRERRALIEDAAGIAGYRHKRRLAELKLEATQANLLRVNDIVSEVERQINSLKRQAAKARRYRRLREELRSKELARFVGRARELDRSLAQLAEEERAARDAEAAAAARLGRVEAALVAERETLERAQQALREAAESAHRLELEIERGEGLLATCRERIAEASARAERHATEAVGLEARAGEAAQAVAAHAESVARCRAELQEVGLALEAQQAALVEAETHERSLRDEIEARRTAQFGALARSTELRNRARNAEETLARVRERRTRLEGERAEARDDLSRLEAGRRELGLEASQHAQRLAAKRAELESDEAHLASEREREAHELELATAAREREQSARSRLALLEDLETRFAGVSDGVKNLLAAGSRAGIRALGVVADYVEASRDVEGAAEHYLQGLLPTVIVESDRDVRAAAVFLREQGAGRTSLISKAQPAGAFAVGTSPNGHGEVPREVLEDGRVLGRLRDKLTLKTAANGAVAERLGDALLVDSLESALELHRRHPTADYLSMSGEVVYASGIIAAGGTAANDGGLLAHRRRTDEARAEVEAGASESALRQGVVDELRLAIATLDAKTRVSRAALEQDERRNVELNLRVQRFDEERERGDRRSEVLADELGALVGEDQSLAVELERLRSETAQAEAAERGLAAELAERAALFDSASASLREAMANVGRLGAAQAVCRERLEAVETEGRRLTTEAQELAGRAAGMRADAGAALELAGTSRELVGRTEIELTARLGERSRLTARSAEIEGEIAEIQERLSRAEAEQGATRVELETLRERTREHELARARADSDRAHLDELCQKELGLSAADAVQSAPPASEGELDTEALEARIEDLRQRIEAIGPVNLTAIDEFAELETRHGFLSTQRQDLLQSMESLRETIRRIDRESRQRFSEAFEAIRQSYQEVFKLLFSGGRADLRLEEGEDVLECGIEILAQPPGKRLSGVHLLSGGEKALSAIALLFAIFRHQPSPFCMLDEVDAALDDSNVARFTRMVGEYAKNTQFVIITHNKLSMESAGLLYGVTMEEPGVSKVVSLELR